MNFTNEAGYGGTFRFSKQTVGLWILEECRRYWKQHDREIDDDLLTHLAGSAPAFESLINPNDPRFLTPGDMPLKIQAYCRETRQLAPRKPGPIIRCVLESVALLHRKTLSELEQVTGRRIECLYLLGASTNPLLNHFTANAIQQPGDSRPRGHHGNRQRAWPGAGAWPYQVAWRGPAGSAQRAQAAEAHSLRDRVGRRLRPALAAHLGLSRLT